MITNYYKGIAKVSEQRSKVGRVYRKECTGVCMPVEGLVTDFSKCECLTKKQ